MTEIERAIQTLEDCRDVAANRLKNGDGKRTAIYVDFDTLSDINQAISALRGQAERGEGCLYCAGYEAEFMLPVIEMSENTANSLDIDGNFAYIHCHCGRHTVGKINYCPMCGRRLEARHE